MAMQSFRLDHHKSPDKVKHARSAKSRKSEAHTAKHMDLRNAEHFESALSDDSMDSLEEEEDIEPAPPPKFEPKAAPVIDLKEEAKRRRQEKKEGKGIEGKGIEVLMPKDDLDHSGHRGCQVAEHEPRGGRRDKRREYIKHGSCGTGERRVRRSQLHSH